MDQIAGLESERKFKYAVQLLQESYAEKMKEMSEESMKWKTLLQKQQKQTATVQADLEKAQQKISLLENQLAEINKENHKLIEIRNSVVEKYNILKKQAIQLRQFKKSIASMIDSDPNDEVIPGLKLPNFQDDIEFDISTDLPDKLNISPVRRISHDTNMRLGNNAPPKAPVSIVDQANELYKEIKEILTTSDFESFAKTINLLNNGVINVERALQDIGVLVKDPKLMYKLQNLIQQAATNEESTMY